MLAAAQLTVLGGDSSNSRVEFLVSITGRDHALAPEVTASDVKVMDSGKNQNVISLKPAKDLPLALGILLDSSLRSHPAYGSVISKAEEQSILSESLSSWVASSDKVLLIRFAEDSPNLAADIHLSDMTWMQQVVSFGTRRDAGTDMLQAIEAYRRELGNPRDVRRTLIVVANGGTFLSNESYNRIVEVALRNSISVEVIDTCPR